MPCEQLPHCVSCRVRPSLAEFYEPLPKCDSWCGIIWTYITNPNIGAYSRVKRNKAVDSSENVNPNDAVGDTYSTTEAVSRTSNRSRSPHAKKSE